MATKRKPTTGLYAGAGRIWTQDELDYLRTAAVEGIGWVAIAAALKRTQNAVQDRAQRIGVVQPSPRAWRKEDVRELERLCRARVPWGDIAKELGRTVKACRSRFGFDSPDGPRVALDDVCTLKPEDNLAYLRACMAELDATTPREFIRAYRSRNELNVPPEPAYKPTIPSTLDMRSCVGSQGAMCEAF